MIYNKFVKSDTYVIWKNEQ